MENVIFRVFEVAFKTVGMLLLVGLMTTVLTDLQRRAFDSKKVGLISMSQINHQLVGTIR